MISPIQDVGECKKPSFLKYPLQISPLSFYKILFFKSRNPITKSNPCLCHTHSMLFCSFVSFLFLFFFCVCVHVLFCVWFRFAKNNNAINKSYNKIKISDFESRCRLEIESKLFPGRLKAGDSSAATARLCLGGAASKRGAALILRFALTNTYILTRKCLWREIIFKVIIDSSEAINFH